MFDRSRILTCGKNLVGFRQDSNSIYDTLYKTAQATAEKTLVFNAAAKTITWTGGDLEDEEFEAGDSIVITSSTSNNATRTIASVAGNVITTVEALVNETSTTARVRATGNLQKSVSGLWVNDLPSLNFEMISANLSSDTTARDYLRAVIESELVSLVNQFANKSKQLYNSKELMDRKSITSGVASFNNKVVQNQRFVGYWIRPHRSDYLRTQIVELGFQATETQATPLKIYLYETSQLEPIATFDFTLNKANSLVWREVSDFILSYQSATGGTGQDYLLGYYEKDLSNPQTFQLQSQAIYMDFTCGCPGEPKEIYGKYMGIQPIEINNEYLNWNEAEGEYFIPLVDRVSDFVTTQTYGLTAKVNVTCDISDVLCQNIGVFARSLQHAVACRILYDAYASNRINSISDSKREQAKSFAMKYDGILNGYNNPDGVRIKGLIDTLTVDFSAMDDYCLPCKPGIMKGRLVR